MSRPVYIPKRKRQRADDFLPENRGRDSDEDERPLHADPRTLLSSATAATTSTTQISQPPPPPPPEAQQTQQRPEDFMDERDHNEWGGPMRVKAEYEGSTTSDILMGGDGGGVPTKTNTSIGEQLLRKLGWRESSDTNTLTAYLPSKESSQNHQQKDNSGITMRHDHHHHEHQQSILLSEKRMRKIVRQQTRVKVPEQWRGHAGLGFEALRDAPEFRAAQQQRRMDQEDRFAAYKVSDVLGPNTMSNAPLERKKDGSQSTGQYESLEDFVGYRSTAGFALREDEDDAYDKASGVTKSIHTLFNNDKEKVSLDRRDYQATVYDHEDSDPDDDDPEKAPSVFHLEALSGWATQTKTTAGRNALKGFVLGMNSNPQKTIYEGPHVPSDWRVSPHVFGPNEHPSIFQAIARAVQIEAVQDQRKEAMQKALKSAQVLARRREGVFTAVGASMKSRFTAEGSAVPAKNEVPKSDSDPWQTMTRSVKPFAPEALLCKRLNVAAPKQNEGAVVEFQQQRTRDQAYFQDEILKVAKEEAIKRSESDALASDDAAAEYEQGEPERPSLSVYRAIFDPVDDTPTDLSETEDANEDNVITEDPAEATKEEVTHGKEIVPYDQPSTSSSEDAKKKRRKKKRSKKEYGRESKRKKRKKDKKKRDKKTD